MASEEIKQQVSTSSDKLGDVRKSIRKFSLSMRDMFVDNETLTSSSAAARFKKLRDDTRNVAVAFAKVGLPLIKQCVSDINSDLEYYIDLTKDKWWTVIADKVEEMKAHKEAFNALVEIHEHFLSELRTLQDDAFILMDERPDVAAMYEDEANNLKIKALLLTGFSAALSYIPQLSGIVALAVGQSARSSMDQSTRRNQQASAENAVVAAIRDTAVPALREFIKALECINCLFGVIQDQLDTLQVKGEKAIEGEKPKYLHYKLMKKKAGQIMNHCNELIKELPSIRSDLLAIPMQGLDDHYVERFQLIANECISRHCTNTKMLNKMKKTCTTGVKKQVIIDSMRDGWSLLEKYASSWGVSPQVSHVFIVFVLIVLFEYFPRALLVLIFLAVLKYFVFF